MADVKSYTFNHSELAEVLVKKLAIHEGHWGIYIEFSLGGANIPTSPDGSTVAPAAIAIVNKIGIQRFDAPNSLTVDAAAVNPSYRATTKKK